MYYVRKLSKTSNFFKIKDADDIKTLSADFLYQEMRTKGNTISVWRSESLEANELYFAVNAALLSSTSIEATRFIILDSDGLDVHKIEKDDKEKGKTSFVGYEHLHTNLCALNLEKIEMLLALFNQNSKNVLLSPLYEKKQVEDMILKAYDDKKIDESVMDEHLKSAYTKLLIKAGKR